MGYTVRTKDNALDMGRAADQNESVDNDIYFKAYCPQLIATNTVAGADATDITFSAIAAGWRNLKLICFLRSDVAASWDFIHIQYNADTGNNYWYSIAWAYYNDQIEAGEGLGVAYTVACMCSGNTAPASVWSTAEITIPQYAGAVYKTHFVTGAGVNQDTTAGPFTASGGGVWKSTAAITSVKLFPGYGTHWKIGSSIQLYGM